MELGKSRNFSLRSDNDKDAHFCHFYSTQYWKSKTEQSGKEKERIIYTGKEEDKLSFFIDGIILYIENPKDSTKKTQKTKTKQKLEYTYLAKLKDTTYK
jgi:hypothetical protein